MKKYFVVIYFFLSAVILQANPKAQKTDSDFIKWWKTDKKDICFNFSKLKPLEKTSSLDLPSSQLPLKVYKLHTTSFGDILLAAEYAAKRPNPAIQNEKSWIGIDSRNKWILVEANINGKESYGTDEINFCIYQRQESTYLEISTNGPACVPAALYELKDPALVKVADKCDM